MTPGLSSMGGGSACPRPVCLRQADDRNALATTAGGIVLAVCICTLKPILAATPARSISLASVNGASLSETKVKADLAPRFSTRSARNSSPSSREVTSVTICRELSDSDQIIKSEHGGTDPRLKNRTTGGASQTAK